MLLCQTPRKRLSADNTCVCAGVTRVKWKGEQSSAEKWRAKSSQRKTAEPHHTVGDFSTECGHWQRFLEEQCVASPTSSWWGKKEEAGKKCMHAYWSVTYHKNKS